MIITPDAGLVTNNEQKGLLDILSESIIWNGRYPVPKKQEHMEHLYELSIKHLFDKKPLGETHLLRPNRALSWESFKKLWTDASKVYWQHHSHQ